MNELTLIAIGVAYLAVFALAHSHRSFLRALGLTGLLLVAAGLLGGAGFMVWGAFFAPKTNEGIANFAMGFLALPLALFGALAAMLLRVAWRYVPGVSPHRFSMERLWQVIKLMRGGGG